mmetsp:Transcript_38276/g.114600  ORF Transcript_38276/g.114600 Transcript_38276/m.114600 type:complete len:416 (+) Transcript_38276:1912-3159(+)
MLHDSRTLEIEVPLEVVVDLLLAHLQLPLDLLVPRRIEHVVGVLFLMHERDEDGGYLPLQLQQALGEGGSCLHDTTLFARLDLQVVAEGRVQAEDAPPRRVGVHLVPHLLPEVDRLSLPQFCEVSTPLEYELNLRAPQDGLLFLAVRRVLGVAVCSLLLPRARLDLQFTVQPPDLPPLQDVPHVPELVQHVLFLGRDAALGRAADGRLPSSAIGLVLRGGLLPSPGGVGVGAGAPLLRNFLDDHEPHRLVLLTLLLGDHLLHRLEELLHGLLRLDLQVLLAVLGVVVEVAEYARLGHDHLELLLGSAVSVPDDGDDAPELLLMEALSSFPSLGGVGGGGRRPVGPREADLGGESSVPGGRPDGPERTKRRRVVPGPDHRRGRRCAHGRGVRRELVGYVPHGDGPLLESGGGRLND